MSLNGAQPGSACLSVRGIRSSLKPSRRRGSGHRRSARDSVDMGQLPASAFDEAYAVARVTPGTNLLAMYALLGNVSQAGGAR